ncbi:MAG: hypothetical protein Fur0018_09190 [Anaerolineales bacterium]
MFVPDESQESTPQGVASPQAAPADESLPPETLALGVSAAPMEDAGMGALEPAFDQAPGDEVFEDAGMQAFEPVLVDEVFEAPPAPQSEMQVPPKESMRGAPIFSAAAFEEPSPDVGLTHAQAPSHTPKAGANPEMVVLFITDERMSALWEYIDKVRSEIPQKIQNLYLARELLDDIEAARNELLNGRENYEEAERFVNEVAYRIAFTERLQNWSSTWGSILFVYEILWGAIFIWGLFRLGSTAFQPKAAPFTYILGSMVWGGVGGVTGALLALIKHITKYQDFDVQHRMWYLGSPIIGAVVGLFMYGVIQVGLFSMTDGNIVSPFIVYILSWLGGYQQNVLTDIIKRLLKTFEIGASPEENVNTSG